MKAMKFRRQSKDPGDKDEVENSPSPLGGTQNFGETAVEEATPPLPTPIPQVEKSILVRKPDGVISRAMQVKGDITFGELIRIDGSFQGTITSTSDQGSVIIGLTGDVQCDLSNLANVYIEGKFTGDVTADKVELRKGASVKGTITCCSLGTDPTISLKGSTNITPRAARNSVKPSAFAKDELHATPPPATLSGSAHKVTQLMGTGAVSPSFKTPLTPPR